MRIATFAASLTAALSGAVPSAAQEAPAAPALDADLILRGGEIYTPHGWTEALAIRNGVIIAVGDRPAADAFRTQRTRVIDLDGATVLPGLHDLHVHPLGAGLMQRQCLFPQGSPPAEIEVTVRACAAQRADGEWIVGGQWDAASFDGRPVDRALLDAAAPNNPVALMDISAHSLWVNSAALEIAGVTAATPNPPGGIIERDHDGRATGVLRESAGGLVRRFIPPAGADEAVEALRWSLEQMLAYGITSLTDALADETALRAYAALADQGLLRQRVRACMAWRGGAFGADGGAPGYVQYRNLYARERVSPSCIKLALDGVPTDGHTAAMVEPYADGGGDTGLLMIPQDTLNPLVARLDALGFTVKMHAAGDGAVRAGLDAIEAAREANGFASQRHEVAHASFVQPEDVARACARRNVRDVAVHLVPESDHPGHRQGGGGRAHAALDPGEGRDRRGRARRSGLGLGRRAVGEPVDRDRDAGDAAGSGRRG